MSCFPAKVMATLVLFLLVGGIDIPATSVSLPYGGRKSLSLDGSKTVPRLQGSSEGLDISDRKIVFFRSLRTGLSPPPLPLHAPGRTQRSRSSHYYGDLGDNPYKRLMPEPEPEPEPTPPPQIL